MKRRCYCYYHYVNNGPEPRCGYAFALSAQELRAALIAAVGEDEADGFEIEETRYIRGRHHDFVSNGRFVREEEE